MISVDCRSVAAHASGLQAYQRSLALHLPAIAPAWHFVFVRQADAPGRLVTQPNTHEVLLKLDAESALGPWMLRGALDTRGVRLFHATGGLYPYGLDVPVVVTVHDVLWLTQPELIRAPGLRGRVTAALCKRAQAMALRHAQRIIVPSEATRRAVESVAPLAACRLRLIPHGFRSDFEPLDQADHQAVMRVQQACARLLGTTGRFVLEVGRAARFRNHEGLVRAFAMAFGRDANMNLVLVQPSLGASDAILKLAAKLGLHRRVHVLTSISTRDLVALYQGAVCLCHPSLHESFGTAVAEAMACGCPVITSTRAAAGELVQGVAHLINPEHDDDIAAAMRRLAYEPGVAERLRARGIERSKTLSAERMARATCAVYQEVLEETGWASPRRIQAVAERLEPAAEGPLQAPVPRTGSPRPVRRDGSTVRTSV